MRQYSIKHISAERAREIIGTGYPRGLFLFPHGEYIAALDNSTADVWTRAFRTQGEAEAWLIMR